MSEHADGEVVSWLLLERYALGELDARGRARVEAALERDAQTRVCLELIRRPLVVPPLPERTLERARRRSRTQVLLWPTVSVLAAAAAAVLVIRGLGPDSDELRNPGIRSSAPSGRIAPPTGQHIKGDALALSVVREHEGQIIANDRRFAGGDRLKVLLTCPTSFRERLRIVVEQGGSVSSPLEVPPDFGCGNEVAVPGAFTLTESTPARVCVQWGFATKLALNSPLVPGNETLCVDLLPATLVPPAATDQ